LALVAIGEKPHSGDVLINLIAFGGVSISTVAIDEHPHVQDILACLVTVLAFAGVNVVGRLLKNVHFAVLGSA
jgi:hypothetical protein